MENGIVIRNSPCPQNQTDEPAIVPVGNGRRSKTNWKGTSKKDKRNRYIGCLPMYISAFIIRKARPHATRHQHRNIDYRLLPGSALRKQADRAGNRLSNSPARCTRNRHKRAGTSNLNSVRVSSCGCASHADQPSPWQHLPGNGARRHAHVL